MAWANKLGIVKEILVFLTTKPITRAINISKFTGMTELGKLINKFAITRANTAITIQTKKKITSRNKFFPFFLDGCEHNSHHPLHNLVGRP